MRIAVAADHAGFPYKEPIERALAGDGHEILDLGTCSTEAVDYPDYAQAVGLAVREGRADLGVLVCGSGAGVAIAANKIRGVRAALCHDPFTARQSREDDDANVICLGARVIDRKQALALVREFVNAKFSHASRHERRLAKVLALEAGELPLPAAAAPRDLAAGPEHGPDEHPDAARALARLTALDAGRRLWAKDASLWSPDPTVQDLVVNRLAWLDAPATYRARMSELEAFADEIRRDGTTDVVLLGMGGSSLAPEVLAATFGATPGWPVLTALDTTDPGAIRAVSARLNLGRTLFVVASKSGTTTEVHVLYRFFRAALEAPGVARDGRTGRHFVAITDPASPLERLAAAADFRRVFLNDPGIGGRFSALSYFGLVPAALVGVDIGRLLARGMAMAEACGPTVPVSANPGLRLGASLAALSLSGRDKVTLVLPEALRGLGAWLEQLLTESTGKHGKGLVVVDDEPLGTPATYGADRVFVALSLAGVAPSEATLGTLSATGHPVLRLELADLHDLGAEFVRWEVATAAAGIVLEVNPFDEPNVAQAKAATQAALATFRDSGQLPQWPMDGVDEVARALRAARPGDYVALLAYVTPEPATTAGLQHLRLLVRDRTRLATTIGYGPRYLHSTGQLHKGGPPTPIVVLLTTTDAEDLPIPGEPYGFATLELAQALGDLATLRSAHRRALWLPLAGGARDAIARLTAELAKRLG
jgi:RpiB/LacA/LacB family sugar-phosphate isomerase